MKPKFNSRLIRGLSAIVLALAAPSAFSATETFNTAGTFNWVCPGGVTEIQVECWGGGGAGGAGRKDTTAGTNTSQNGGGGGGGAYAKKISVPVTAGASYTITIPAAAVSGSAGTTTNGQGRVNGGTVTFVGDLSTTVTAAGGQGGANAYTTVNGTVGAAAGTGGTTAASVGDVGALFAGGTGSAGNTGATNVSGSGGGGAGNANPGGAAVTTASTTAAGPGGVAGGGAGGAGRDGGNTNAGVGAPGSTPGGGGGGGHNQGINTRLGGNGGLGQITLTYTDPPANFKGNNPDNLNLVSSWTAGYVPTAGNVPAEWNNLVAGANTTSLGANIAFSGIKISDPGGPVTINGDGINTLTLGAAAIDLDLSTATQDLTLNCDLAMSAANVWNVTSAKTLTLGGAVSGSAAVTKQGAGTATLNGANTYSGITTVNGGSMNLTGSLVNASLGNVVIQADGTLNASGTVTGGTSTALTYGTTAGLSTVNVSSGANLTLGALAGSNNASAVSIYNQTGGTVNLNAATTTTDTSYLAQLGYGHLNLTGGSIASNSRFSVTFSSTGASGVARIGGGAGAATLSSNDLLAIGRTSSATGEMTVLPNGAVTYNGTGANNMLLLGNAINCTGFLNIVGGTFSSPVKGISWGNGTTTNGGLGLLNLGAGTLEIGANVVVNTIASGNNRGYVNLSGGTLKMRSSGITTGLLPVSSAGFSGTGGLANTIFGVVTNSTVNLDGSGAASDISGTVGTTQDFVGGVTINTNGFNSTFTSQLTAPTGNGVAQGNLSITGGSGYVAPPIVKFSNPAVGNATPAAGYALVSGGQVTGIVITCPGNYDTVETPTVTLSGGGGTGASVTVIGTLAANTSGGLTKTGAGTLTLNGANTYTGATTVNGGQLVVSGSGTLATGSGLSVASSAAFRYLPTTIGSTLTTSSLSLANGSALGLAWDATTANQIAVTGAASVGSGTGVALDMGSGYTSGTSYTILTAASGLDVGNYSFLNLTDFNMSVVKTPISVSITPTITTPLTGTYWRGTTTAGLTKIWAATDGNTDSNWSTTDSGATQGLVPGVGADVFIPSTLPVVPATSTVLGANMAIKTLTIADTTNGMSLDADGNTLTITPGAATSGILMNASVPASSIATNVALGAAQTWTNDSTNALTMSGGISGSFALTKAGSGQLILPGANSFAGGLTIRAGEAVLGTATSAGTGTLTFDNGGLGSASAQFSSGSALTVANPITVAPGSTSTNTLSGIASAALIFNGAVTIDTGTTLAVDNSSPSNSSIDIGTGVITGGGSLVTSGTSTGNFILRGANTYSGGTTLGGSGIYVPALSSTGPAGSPTDGIFGTGIVNIGNISIRSTNIADTTIGNSLILAGDLTAVTVSSEKSLTFSGPATLTGTRTITTSVGSTVAGRALTFSGSISESSSGYGLTKTGTGPLILNSDASTYTGPVIISAGILQSNGTGTLANIGTASALGLGNATSNATNAASLVLDGGTYSMINTNAPVTTDRLFTLTQNGGTLSADNGTAINVIAFGNTAPISHIGSGARTLTLGGAHAGGNNANLFAPQITDAGSDVVSLQKTGATNWALTNTNTYTGSTTINGGTLQLGDGTSGNDGTIANTSGVTNNGTLAFNRFGSSTASYAISGTGAVTKLGAGTQTLSGLSATAASNYSGLTTIDQGTLTFTTTSPSLTGGLTFGSSAGSTNAGSLDLGSASATFGGGMVVRTNSASSNVMNIGAGQTLTFTGSTVANAISVGSGATGAVAKLQVTGSGTLTVNDSTRNIVVANTDTTGPGASAELDLSGLGTFNATIANLCVGRPTSVAGAAASGRPNDIMKLAANNSLTVSGFIVVGGTNTSPNAGTTQQFLLGQSNTIHSASIVVGSSRIPGNFAYNTGLTNPSVTLRGAAGGSTPTNIYLGDAQNALGVSNGSNGSTAIRGTMDFTGGSVDAVIDELIVGNGGFGTGGNRGAGHGTFIIDGALSNVDVNTLVLARTRNDAGANASAASPGSSIFTLKNGTLVVNTEATLAKDIDTTNTASGVQNVVADFNVEGGTATIGSIGTPVNLILGTHVASGNPGSATATVDLTGGTLNMFGDIQEGTLGNGTIISSLTLDGATLDMKGNSLGVSGALVDTLELKSGTLRNVEEINNGGALAKTGAGTLTLAGTNTYTGATIVSSGTLALGASDVLPNGSALSIDAATLDAGSFTDTVGTLDPSAAATINLGSGATIAFADSSAIDWTGGSLNITGTFVSGSSVRFGTTSGGLTSTQRGLITINSASGTYSLDANGYLVESAGGYASWASTNAPTGTSGDDFDNDGVSNGVEYVLGGDKDTNDLDKLPTISTTLGGDMVFTFERDQASIDGSTIVEIEVSTDLVTWPDTFNVPDTALANNPGVTVVKDTPADFDTVTLTVEQDPDTTKFARLKVIVTP